MSKRILWIDDDYYAIKGLFRPLERQGYVIEPAFDALEGLRKAEDWTRYDLIVVDLIIPLNSTSTATVPESLKVWENERFCGLGVIKALRSMNIEKPIVLLSIAAEMELGLSLDQLGIAASISKMGISPGKVFDTITRLLDTQRNSVD